MVDMGKVLLISNDSPLPKGDQGPQAHVLSTSALQDSFSLRAHPVLTYLRSRSTMFQ